MFLSLLKAEPKQLFLGLAECLASSDGDFSQEEELYIEGYEAEMGVSFDRENCPKGADTIIGKMSGCCTEQEKRIIVYEIIGLAMVDGRFDSAERDLIRKLSEAFGLDPAYAGQCEGFLQRYVDLQNELNRIVLG